MNLKKKLTIIIFAVTVLLVVFLAVEKKADLQRVQLTPTMEDFLQTALEPVGSTMYIWGGGWDDEDSKAGATSTQIGVSPQWKIFYSQQDESYDYNDHRYERENGLDCSGYVGWVIYNTFENDDGKDGYVAKSTELAESLAARGWGKLIKNPKEFLAGDIVSMDGHVWICLGTCTDGSVLLVHSSPPGVSVCGTQITEGESSIAIELATEFMEKNYPQWQEKYPERRVSDTYLENVTVFRWNENILKGAEQYQNLRGEELLTELSRN